MGTRNVLQNNLRVESQDDFHLEARESYAGQNDKSAMEGKLSNTILKKLSVKEER